MGFASTTFEEVFMNSENNCAVYVHVNLINGKKYFGITTQEPEKRWKNGSGYSNNAHFTNAINKYGWGNFAHYVLYKDIPIKIAKNIEEMLIQEHFSYDPKFGYNKTYGGELEKRTKETRRKISDATREAMNCPEVAAKVSKAMKAYFKEHPEAHPMKRPEAAAKNAKARSKPVEAVDPETGLRVYCFKSTMDAKRSGFSSGHISECCRGKKKTHHGYIWRYINEEVDDDGNY